MSRAEAEQSSFPSPRSLPTMLAAAAAAARDGADLILSLPEDVVALISAHLRPRDLLALSAASRRLRRALSADKAWLAQCRRLLPSPAHLLAWRAAAAAAAGGGGSLAVCRFLHSAAPLLGLWAHQNPELGNLVAAVPGFLSVVAARAIPQELSPRLRWAPVFELLADDRGRPALLFLHGHHHAHLFPGLLASLQPHANVIFLEAHTARDPLASSSSSSSSTQRFARLSFGDRRRLLDSLVAACRVTLPPEVVDAPLFACSDDDLPLLAARREAMLRLHREAAGGMVRTPEVQGLLARWRRRTADPRGRLLRRLLRRILAGGGGAGGLASSRRRRRRVASAAEERRCPCSLPLPFLHWPRAAGGARAAGERAGPTRGSGLPLSRYLWRTPRAMPDDLVPCRTPLQRFSSAIRDSGRG